MINVGNSGASPGGEEQELTWVGLEEQESIRDKLAFLGAFTSARSYRSSIGDFESLGGGAVPPRAIK